MAGAECWPHLDRMTPDHSYHVNIQEYFYIQNTFTVLQWGHFNMYIRAARSGVVTRVMTQGLKNTALRRAQSHASRLAQWIDSGCPEQEILSLLNLVSVVSPHPAVHLPTFSLKCDFLQV